MPFFYFPRRKKKQSIFFFFFESYHLVKKGDAFNPFFSGKLFLDPLLTCLTYLLLQQCVTVRRTFFLKKMNTYFFVDSCIHFSSLSSTKKKPQTLTTLEEKKVILFLTLHLPHIYPCETVFLFLTKMN